MPHLNSGSTRGEILLIVLLDEVRVRGQA